MLRITAADVKGDKDLIRYISEESDESDEEKVLAKHSDREPIITPDIRFGNVVIVVGIPKVSADKTKKLMAVLVRKFASEFEKNGIRTLPNSNNFDMITDNDGNSLGIAFLTMSNDKEALEAAEILKGYQLDAKHRFSAATTPQIEDILNRSPDYVPPQPIQGITREQNRWWLEDPRSRAQFFVRRDQETEIFWHDPLEKEPVLICNRVKDKDSARKVWTDLRAQWSTHGSYFATFHRPGVALWSGPEFDKKIRLEHPGVKQIEFSPRENYAVTWDGTSASQKVSSAIIIWRVITGTALKTLPTPNRTPRGVGTKYIAWSHDDRFCSLFENDEICVYELPNMTQVHEIEKKTSPVNYQSEKFDWSPATDMIAIWCPGSIDTPGRLQITRMPTRQEVTSKNVYSVGEAAIHWHPHGKYLCLRATVTRKTGKKSKKGLTQLEIFRMEEKDIPVDTVTIEDLPIKQFHWEEGNSKTCSMMING